MKYRKKPIVIEALQLRWDNWSEMCEFAKVGYLSDGNPEGTYVDANGKPSMVPVNLQFADEKLGPDFRIGILIPTLEGLMLGVQNDFIIRGVKGELYPCKPDIFEMTYETAE
jgi:hypothetical protein